LNKWNAGKNVHRNEMKAIVHKRQRRVVTEPAKPGYVFELRGEPVPEDKIQRFMKRWELPVDAAYSPTSGARESF
jgi:2-hydroxychromene-2-carboxylate isomerase